MDAIKRWAVVCSDCDRSAEIIDSIEKSCGKEVFDRHRGRNQVSTRFTDGTIIRWISDRYVCKGSYFDKMWCDKDINMDVYNNRIRHMIRGREEDVVIWL